jgi:putative CocE/NonD family hydrolase
MLRKTIPGLDLESFLLLLGSLKREALVGTMRRRRLARRFSVDMAMNSAFNRTFSLFRWVRFVALAAAMGTAVVAQENRVVEIGADKNVAVPMRDGTILRADVYQPREGGPFPVLVFRTPYGKPAKVDEELVRSGFIVVQQDARGRYASDGQYESYVRYETHDGSDGYDTVQWAAKLPNSTGKVGTFGTSYNAFLQWRTAAAQPPSLQAMAAFSIPARHTDLEGPGTIRPGRRLKWWQGTISPDLRKRAGGPKPHTSAEAAEQWNAGEGERLFQFLPWLDLPDDLFGSEASYVKDWIRKPWSDPWKLEADAAKTIVPNLNVCGWYDHCNGSIDLHTAIVKSGGSESARTNSLLLIGPWSHSSLGARKQGEIDFGPEAALDLSKLQREWFGHWLRGDAKNKWPSVKLFVMGVNEWRAYEAWPPNEFSATKEFFLSSVKGAQTPQGDGRLSDQPAATSGSDGYDYDPRDPVPTLWTKALFTVPADQKALADRKDILVYQSPPLTTAVETIGYPEAVLYASSNCDDTDFFARLIDVAPDGTAIDIASGMVRARYRNSLEKSELIKPREVIEYKIKLQPTAHRFLAGHRIRLDVTSSDFPNYDRNHNTPADQNSDSQLVTAQQKLFFGGNYASKLRLPISR